MKLIGLAHAACDAMDGAHRRRAWWDTIVSTVTDDLHQDMEFAVGAGLGTDCPMYAD